ncbi:hypothetical protein I4U23_005471 [Adineta vaga]|nr:hypothetical protein I4U23_005471 [Adineta vaga]
MEKTALTVHAICQEISKLLTAASIKVHPWSENLENGTILEIINRFLTTLHEAHAW